MARRFKLVTVDFQDYVGDLVGVSKDNYVRLEVPNQNNGANTLLSVNHYNGTGYTRTVIVCEVAMPLEDDLPESDTVEQILLGWWVLSAGSMTPTALAIYPLPDADAQWLEGTQVGVIGYSNWDDRDTALPWSNFADHSALYSEDDVAIESIQVGPSIGYWVWFDLTRVLNLGDKKSFYIRNLIDSAGKNVGFASREAIPSTHRPILRIISRDYPPDAFEDEDSYLTIQPSPNNPEEPRLEWGKVSHPGFANYKIYRKTTLFTKPSEASLIATIADPGINYYVDTSALNENQVYYYMAIAEDNENVGDAATLSALVSFKRPDNNHSEISETINVGDLVNVTITSNVPFKRRYIEWGDATDGYWIGSEVETLSFTVSHRYSSTGAKVIKARLESSLGYWSDLDTVCTKTLNDISPEAVLIVRPLEVVTGESVRCVGSKSQPVASDVLIDKYDYYVNGAWLNPLFPLGPDQGAVKEVIPNSSQEIRLRIHTDSGLQKTILAGSGENVTVISGIPTDLIFSKDTTVNTRQESRESIAVSLGIMDGVGEVEIPTNIKNRVYSINGLSARQDFKTDIDKIRLRQETQEYTRIKVYDEKEGVTVQLDGRIAGYSITQTTSTYVSWTFGFKVFKRSEV